MIGGIWLFARYFLVAFFPCYFGPSTPRVSDFDDFFPSNATGLRETEWIKGETLCTYLGSQHIAWSIPLAEVSYYVPSVSVHSFLMFVPFFIMDDFELAAQGVILALTGPILAAFISANLHEQVFPFLI